jgi:hypothetical protein
MHETQVDPNRRSFLRNAARSVRPGHDLGMNIPITGYAHVRSHGGSGVSARGSWSSRIVVLPHQVSFKKMRRAWWLRPIGGHGHGGPSSSGGGTERTRGRRPSRFEVAPKRPTRDSLRKSLGREPRELCHRADFRNTMELSGTLHHQVPLTTLPPTGRQRCRHRRELLFLAGMSHHDVTVTSRRRHTACGEDRRQDTERE